MTVRVISSDHPSWQCTIYNGTLQTLIWSQVWKILSLFWLEVFFLSIYATVLCYHAEQVFFWWNFYFFVSLGLKLVFNPELKNLNLIQNKQINKNNIFSKIIEQDCWLHKLIQFKSHKHVRFFLWKSTKYKRKFTQDHVIESLLRDKNSREIELII